MPPMHLSARQDGSTPSGRAPDMPVVPLPHRRQRPAGMEIAWVPHGTIRGKISVDNLLDMALDTLRIRLPRKDLSTT